MEILQR